MRGAYIALAISTACSSSSHPGAADAAADAAPPPPCGSDADCPTTNGVLGVCLGSGACASPADVLFAGPAGTGSACTRATPCALETATAAVATAATAATIIELAPGSYPLAAELALTASVQLVGSGAVLDAGSSAGEAAVRVTAGSAELDFVTVVASGQDGIDCADAALALFRVTDVGNAALGVSATNCALAIERSTIAQNAGGGVLVAGGRFDLENDFIVLNGSAGAGIGGAFLDPDASAAGSNVLLFDTVGYNQAQPGIDSPGISCTGSAAIVIEQTITAANTQSGSAAQIGSGCTVAGPTIALPLDPDNTLAFAMPSGSAFDFHVGSASVAVDVAGDDGATCGGVDFDGNPRPQQQFCCIGADEYVPGQPVP